MSKRTLINWSKKLNYEIANARAVELELLQDEYYMLNERRIKLFGEKLKAISKEIISRDLNDVSTEKLFELFFMMYNLLEKEAVDVEYKSDEEIGDSKKLEALSLTPNICTEPKLHFFSTNFFSILNFHGDF